MTVPRFRSVFAHVFFRFRIHRGGASINFNKPFVVLCLAFLCGSSLVACTRLKIKRFSPPPPFLSNADADRILSDMTTVLRTNDGPGDVACNVKFRRKGGVEPFTTGDGSIDSQAEFDAVLALPGHVKVIRRFNWCGALIPNIISCERPSLKSFLVIRHPPNSEGIFWAHLYGHTKGLPHRNDPNAVMNPVIGPNSRRVNSSECAAFRQP